MIFLSVCSQILRCLPTAEFFICRAELPQQPLPWEVTVGPLH